MSIAYSPTQEPKPVRRRKRRRLFSRTRTVWSLLRGCAADGRWWLMPLVIVTAVSAVLVALVQLVEVAAPFVYSIF